MIEKIGGVVIFVQNQEKAIDFYSNQLGFEVKGKYPYKNTNWVELAPKNSSTTISLMEPNHDVIINGEIDHPKQENKAFESAGDRAKGCAPLCRLEVG